MPNDVLMFLFADEYETIVMTEDRVAALIRLEYDWQDGNATLEYAE